MAYQLRKHSISTNQMRETILNYRIAGRGIIPDDTGKVILLVEQVPEENFWIIPGDGVEEGETSTQAAIRELREETGLEVDLVRLL